MAAIDVKSTSQNISIIMRKEGITVKDVQTVCECSHQVVYAWLNGRTLPSMDNMIILSELLDVDLKELVVMVGSE